MARTTPVRLLVLLAFLFISPAASAADLSATHPALDPPFVSLPDADSTDPPIAAEERDLGQTEWTWHRTLDGHPSGDEQRLIWLMNRARANPAMEGLWLSALTDPNVVQAVTFYKVDKALLKAEFAALTPRPPAAFDSRLYAAALAHAQDQVARETQDHNGQGARIDAAGFLWQGYRLSVYSYVRSSLHAHAGLNIDWGNDPTGMQAGRGHRTGLMATDGDWYNVGVSIVPVTRPGAPIGPLVMVADYVKAKVTLNQFNTFIVGTVWQDRNGNGMYDAGEGVEGVEVRPDNGSWYAVTSASGGYAIPVAGSRPVRLTFSGVERATPIMRDLPAGTGSVLADLAVGQETHAITASAGPGGTISPSGSFAVPTGESASVTISPADGYSIEDVTVDGVSVGPVPVYRFSDVTGDHVIEAEFGPGDATVVSTSGSTAPRSDSGSGGGGGGGGCVALADGEADYGLLFMAAAAALIMLSRRRPE